LKTADTTKTYERFSSVIAQTAAGSWVQVDDTAGLAAVGRVEQAISLGSTSSDVSAIAAARAQLAESAAPLVSGSFRGSTLAGPQPYIDFDIGDQITAPAHRGGGTTKLRVLQITVDATKEVVDAYPDGVEDLS
jgi:hypothetical protein